MPVSSSSPGGFSRWAVCKEIFGEPPVGAANQWYQPVEPEAEAVMLLPQVVLMALAVGAESGFTVKVTGIRALVQKGVV